MRLMPSKHWSFCPSGDLCLVQKLVEIAHTDEDGIVHEQTARDLLPENTPLALRPVLLDAIGRRCHLQPPRPRFNG
jgi:hypothetical protein